ncbi:hypothetical protein [Natrinema versiforme]|uniref:Uncharacterized protein n=1 Tax=Natrinema versiforme TaxID=88724 RepID=A0A4P8WK68_9EURY|nr:hypothetical protein [Natrinema versiforme]QCS43880.1 hypothetical protein FEJ81_16570 [Natrinema versiforme]
MRFGDCPNCGEYKYLTPERGICPTCEDDTGSPGIELTPRLELFGEEAREFFEDLSDEFGDTDLSQLQDSQKDALFAKHRAWENLSPSTSDISYVDTAECEQIIDRYCDGISKSYLNPNLDIACEHGIGDVLIEDKTGDPAIIYNVVTSGNHVVYKAYEKYDGRGWDIRLVDDSIEYSHTKVDTDDGDSA